MLLAACPLSTGIAQNTMFTYQGRVTDNGTNFNGVGHFKFALTTSNNATVTTFWSNDGTSINGSQPSVPVNANVSNGLFTVVLGDTTLANMTAIGASIFNQPNLQLQIWFSDGVHAFASLNPPQNLTPAPYAVFAQTANNLLNGLSVQPNAEGAPNVIGGSSANYVTNGVVGATIGGGGAVNYFGGGAYSNSIVGDFGTVGGGIQNVAGSQDFVGGGADNTAGSLYSTVGGGVANSAIGIYSTVSGGYGNIANGSSSMVPGGSQNIAGGLNSFAAGNSALAFNDGCFVWADNAGGSFASTTNNQFLVRAANGVGINTASPASGLLEVRTKNTNDNAIRFGYYTGGAGNLIANSSYVGIATEDLVTRLAITQGGNVGIGTNSASQKLVVVGNIVVTGTVLGTSDRNAKEHFQPVNSRDILEKVAGLPISRWDYKEDAGVTHVGPMAQDFYAAFKVGLDDKHIATVDADGVALAAIQGLNDKVVELTSENAALKARLDKLEKLISSRP